MPPLARFIALYAGMYAAYGVASPFLPAFLNERGVAPEQLGLVLAAGTLARLVSAPVAGRIADIAQSLRAVMVVCIALAAALALAYLPGRGFWFFLALTLLHAAFLAPMTVLADALALRQRFEYGWARGAGSAAFILGTLVSGQTVGAFGLDAIVWAQAALLALAACAGMLVPEFAHQRPGPAARAPMAGVGVLLRIPAFRNLVLVAALILGSHAMHDGFAVIRWSAAGLSASTASLLWSAAVMAEVVVFFAIGPALIRWLTPAGAMALAALAAMARWAAMALTTDLVALAIVQPLHGITFALLHLACMRLLARIVPAGLEATAQAIYATVGIGAASALFTLLSGILYGQVGAHGFWVMAALCAAALPFTFRLRA